MYAIKKYWFVFFAGSIFITIFIIENINGRFWLNDFKVYYEAAKAFLNANPVYGVLFALGSGYFKYSPFTLLLFVPYCIFSFETARIIHYVFLSFSIICLFCLCGYIINKYFINFRIKRKNLLLAVALICSISHLVRELHLGNINVTLLLLVILSLFLLLKSQFVTAGISFALVLITKPFFILLFLPLLFRKKIKTILSAFSALIFFSIVPAFFIGWKGNLELQSEWVRTMLEHNASFPSNNTIESLLKIYFNFNLTSNFQYYLLPAVIAGYLVLFLKNRTNELKYKNSEKIIVPGFLFECFLLLALIPDIFKTDTQHFILSLPLIIFLLYYLSKEKKYFPILIFVVVIFLYGGNSPDIVGKTFSQKMDDSGILGISNLLLIIIAMYAYYDLEKQISVNGLNN